MLNEIQIREMAKFNNLKPWQQEKHYIQNMALTQLTEEPLTFKGGTYLWFFHHLNRFSEDLDFTASGQIKKEIAEKTSKHLNENGIRNSIKLMQDNEIGLTFRIGAEGPLYKNERSTCYLYVEISKRETQIEKPLALELINDAYSLPTKIVSGMNLEEVAAEKVRAIMTREKARDTYDLWFLIKKGITPKIENINKKLAFYNEEFSQKEFYKKLHEKEQIFKKELEPLVIGKLLPFKEVEKEIKKEI
jgi:predicted nucleotidyltransferase component of viral defense system